MISALAAAVFATNVFHTSASAVSIKRDSDLICNQRGWGTTTDAYYGLAPPGFSNCYQYCQAGEGSTCVSFAWAPNSTAVDESSGYCLLYNVPADGNFAPDDSSPYEFFDLACAQARMQCGLAGYADIDAVQVTQVDSLASCAAICDQQNEFYTQCFSYSYGTDGSCGIYQYFVADNVNADSTSPYQFYDYLCDKPSTSASATAVTSTTTATGITIPTTDASATTTTNITATTTTDSTDTTDQVTATNTEPTDTSSTDTITTDAPTATNSGSSDATATVTNDSWDIHHPHRHHGHGWRQS